MPALLAPLIIWIISSAVAKIFISMGIGLFTYFGVEALVETFLDQAQGAIASLPVEVIAILHIAGVDQALSLVGGALLTNAAVKAAKLSVGLSIV